MQLLKQLVEITVERRRLVRILAITQSLRLRPRQSQRRGQRLLGQIRGDGGIVGCRVGEGFGGKPPPRLKGQRARLEAFEHRRIIRRVNQGNDVGEILGCGAQQGHAANINLLNRLVERHIGARNCLLEGIEVDDEQINGQQAVCGKLGHVLRQIAAGEQASVDGGVERLHAAIEDFGKARQRTDGLRGNAGFGEYPLSVARRDEFHPTGVEGASQVNDARLIVDAK